MRLKKLIVSGFKSFADKTEFDFGPGISGIVGPNGCGKSNVVDSMKWVLGEQRPTKLRGTEMADVLFNGSGSKKPVGLAEVTLVFDNSKKILPIDFAEVAVTRKLYRSGESQYLLNREPVRLRDLREMFMDTGVGVENYSVMEQGRMDAFLEAGPQERRALFEEAAGISKYKSKKVESLRKLERVEENLSKLGLVTGEIESKVRSLKIQAGRAQKYLELNDELKDLRIRVSMAGFAEAFRDHERVFAEVQGLVAQVEAGRTSLVESESRVEMVVEDLESHRQAMSGLARELSEIQSRRREASERHDFGRRRIADLDEDRRRIGREVENGQGRLHEIRRDAGNVLSFRDRVREDERTACERLESERERLESLEHEARASAEEIRSMRRDVVELVSRETEFGNRILELEGEIRYHAGTKARLEKRLQEAGEEREQRSARLAELERNLAEARAGLEERRAELKRQEDEEAALAERIDQLKARRAQILEERSGLAGRLDMLSSLIQDDTGPTGGARALAAHTANGGAVLGQVRGMVSDHLEVEADCALAVDSALAEVALALVVDPGFNHAAASQYLLKKELTAVILDPSLGRRKGPVEVEVPSDQLRSVTRATPLSDRVRAVGPAGELLAGLLGGVYVTPTLNEAIRLVARSGPGVRAVTRGGEWVGDHGTIRVGRFGAGPLQRTTEIRQLSEALAKLQSELDKSVGTLEGLEGEVGQKAASIKFLKRMIYDGEFGALDCKKSVENQKTRVRELEEEVAGIHREGESVDRELGRLTGEKGEFAARAEESKARRLALEGRIVTLEEAGARREQEREARREEVTRCKVLLGQAIEKKRSVEEQAERLEAALAERERDVERAVVEECSSRDRIDRARALVQESKGRLEGLDEVKGEVTGSIERLQPREEQLETQVEEFREQVRSVRERVETESARLAELRISERELSVRRESLAGRVREEYGVDLDQLVVGFDPSQVDVATEEARIEDLKQRIGRIGNVNLAAIDELKELDERLAFLTTQKEDLEKSRTDLREIIKQLNKKSKELFEKAFDEIRANFQTLFRKLFGGGKADVFLTDPEDTLESGIEIVARPPGKEPRTVRLLSGGERAMTAIGLLFAIFKTRPSPFAILDEIDAPLDEANTDRFTGMLKEFLDTTQFLIITHSKRTMRICDVLFGVTMEESGVSKRISVKLDDAA